jgi:hypothetical protein
LTSTGLKITLSAPAATATDKPVIAGLYFISINPKPQAILPPMVVTSFPTPQTLRSRSNWVGMKPPTNTIHGMPPFRPRQPL